MVPWKKPTWKRERCQRKHRNRKSKGKSKTETTAPPVAFTVLGVWAVAFRHLSLLALLVHSFEGVVSESTPRVELPFEVVLSRFEFTHFGFEPFKPSIFGFRSWIAHWESRRGLVSRLLGFWFGLLVLRVEAVLRWYQKDLVHMPPTSIVNVCVAGTVWNARVHE